ncbi:MAG: hypothetical protein IIC86_09235 [Chloroflexi bacterium]|nr:hypothetical protein [Chloroflexota bacterium]
MNELNRYLVVVFAAASVVAMAVVIFLTWAAPTETIDALADIVQFMDDSDGTAGKLVITLGALALAVLALLWIILELAPDDDVKELRIEQAGATTIVPADALRLRLEESLLGLGGVTAARSRVWPRDKGVAVGIDLTVVQTANVGDVTQQAVRAVVDTLHEDLGLPVSGTPDVRITFGGSRSGDHAAATIISPPPPEPPHAEQPRAEPEMPPPPVTDPTDPSETPTEPPAQEHADASPDTLLYDASKGDEERPGDSQPPL